MLSLTCLFFMVGTFCSLEVRVSRLSGEFDCKLKVEGSLKDRIMDYFSSDKIVPINDFELIQKYKKIAKPKPNVEIQFVKPHQGISPDSDTVDMQVILTQYVNVGVAHYLQSGNVYMSYRVPQDIIPHYWDALSIYLNHDPDRIPDTLKCMMNQDILGEIRYFQLHSPGDCDYKIAIWWSLDSIRIHNKQPNLSEEMILFEVSDYLHPYKWILGKGHYTILFQANPLLDESIRDCGLNTNIRLYRKASLIEKLSKIPLIYTIANPNVTLGIKILSKRSFSVCFDLYDLSNSPTKLYLTIAGPTIFDAFCMSQNLPTYCTLQGLMFHFLELCRV